MPHWFTALPILSALALAASFLLPVTPLVAGLCVLLLVAAVTSSVHHAELVAHKLGEPLGTLVLALAITVIEVALIISLMVAGGPDKATLPRDTVYSAVMIICTGVVGVCILVGGLHHREQAFNVSGANPALAALIALAGLSLILPVFTTSSETGTYTASQLVFVALSSLALWGSFVFIQTVRHRDYFLPASGREDENVHGEPPTTRQAWQSLGLLLLSLVAVVGLAKQLSPSIEAAVAAMGAPQAVIGVAIALLVLMPETVAALAAARANRLQTSMNLALGSALASIGLSIPSVVVIAVAMDLPLVLGLGAKDLALLSLTLVISAVTLGTGRTNIMQGAIHLVLFAAFIFLTFVP